MGSQSVNEMMRYMRDSFYTCTEEWLFACVEWIKENYTSSQLTSNFMKAELYGQWLDANLVEMESSCLPPNLLNQKVTTLTGHFGLQVNSVQDIGEPSYSQCNKLKKRENENTNVSAEISDQVMQTWEPKPRRCLYLSLTDGCQHIFGMEVVSIPSLSLAVKPGAKIIVNGPVECHRGVLLLKPVHIKILGGEVESLVIENSQENLLSRNLICNGEKASEVVLYEQIASDKAVCLAKAKPILGSFSPIPTVNGSLVDGDVTWRKPRRCGVCNALGHTRRTCPTRDFEVEEQISVDGVFY